MARKLLLLPILLFLFSVSAKAQGFDLFGGFTFERLGTSPGRNLSGAEITAQFKFANVVGLAADLDAHFGLPSQLDGRTLHFMVGPQLSLPTRVSPFFHVLGGIGHVYDGGLSSTSVAAAIGGGIDMHLAPFVSWRVIQGDDIFTHFFGGTQQSPRVSTGIVLRF